MNNQQLHTGRNYLIFSLYLVLILDQILGIGLAIIPGLSIKNLYLYVIVIFLVSSSVLHGTFVSEYVPRYFVAFAGLVVFGLASWGLSTTIHSFYDGTTHLISLKNQLIDPFLFFSVFFFGCQNLRDVMWMAKRICVLIAIISILLLADFVDFPNLGLLGQGKYGRMAGAVGTTNQFAAFLSFYVFSLVAMILSRQNLVLMIAGAVSAMTLILLTVSRGAFVGVILGVMMSAVLLRRYLDTRNVLKIGGIAIVSLSVIGIAAFLAYPELFLSRLARLQADTLAAASSGRTLMWTGALANMWQNPYSFIVGLGWDMFDHSLIHRDPHNHYLFIFYGLGAIGLSLYLWIFADVIRSALSAIKHTADSPRRYLIGFVYGLMSMLICIFFVVLYTPWLFIWSYTGLMARLAWLSSQSSEPEVIGRPVSRKAAATARIIESRSRNDSAMWVH